MNRSVIIILVVIWCAAAAWGLGRLSAYAQTPGEHAAAPAAWPSACGLDRDPDNPTLLLFLHPRCPCSAATLGEIERLLAQVRRPIDLVAVVCWPDGAPADWSVTSLRARVERLPGVAVIDDRDGRLRRAFAARTSGHTLLYDRAARLRFSGGVTPARGHEGDNAGRAALVRLVNGDPADASATPVYGCELDCCAAPSTEAPACPKP